MKFIRDIISEKRSQAMGQPRVAPEPAPRPPVSLESPRPAPLPQDVMAPPRAPAVARPAFQLPLSALVSDEDDDDILNILNPADDDEEETPGAIAADDFRFGHKETPRAFGDVLAEEDEENEDEDDAEDTASAVKAAVAGDAVVSGLDEDVEEDAEFADADMDAEMDEEEDFDEADLTMTEEAGEVEAPAEPVSRASLFRAISEMDVTEEDAPEPTRSWTGAMPPAPPRAAEPAPQPEHPAMMAAPAAPAMPPMPPRPQVQPQTQSISLRATPAPELPRAAAPVPDTPRAPAAEMPCAAAPMPPRAEDGSIDVPSPAIGRGSRRAGRVKTRLLGFNGGQMRADPFAAAARAAPEATEEDAAPAPVMYPVGWLVVIAGPGTGASFPLSNGVSQIGRGPGQAIRLDLGDNSISRENHAAIAYDGEERKFYLGHGGKANLVRLNNRPVLSTEELSTGNTIRIGETTLRFVALCGADFDWAQG